MMVEIRFLGKFEIRSDGAIRDLAARKAQSLLAYLLINRRAGHRREKVAGILWPDSDESNARSRLRYALWQLRQAIGDEIILADKVSLSVNKAAEYWLDVEVLEAGDPDRSSSDDLRQSLSVYQGELLPGFYEDWVSLERDRLHAVYEERSDLLIGRLLQESQWREVIELAEGWISMGGAPEPAYRALMISHSHLGDVSGAVSAYQRCVDSLQEYLGVEPSGETQQLYDLIFSGGVPEIEFTPGPEAGDIHQERAYLPAFLEQDYDLPHRRKNVFVGRLRELAWLDAHMEAALGGDGRVVFIRGDAGRGKTTLLQEFSARALAQHDDLVVVYGSAEAHSGLGDPHLPFRDVLTMLTGGVEARWLQGVISTQGARRLWELLPESVETLLEGGPDLVGSFIQGEALLSRAQRYTAGDAGWLDQLQNQISLSRGRPAPINIQHRDVQRDLFEQYNRVLRRLSRRKALLIVLDDLQWADSGSTSLLFHIARRMEGHRILIAGVYRPHGITCDDRGEQNPLARVITELRRYSGDIEIDLDQRDQTAGRRFVDELLDSERNRLEDDFRNSLYSHTAGHPLFTVELLRQMQAQGDLLQDDEGCWMEGPRIDWVSLPVKVEAVIAGRIDHLPADLKAILRTASVEGEEFSAEVIARVNGSDEKEILTMLSDQLDRLHNLVEAVGTLRVGQQRLSCYRFRHNLFQKYVYDSLDQVEQTNLHEEVGLALEAFYAGQSDSIAVQLARHFEAAGLYQKAVGYLLIAGESAKGQSANEEAIAYLKRGLRLLEDLPADPFLVEQELALQVAIAAPLVATQGYTSPQAEGAFARAYQLSEQIDDPEQLPAVLWGLWSFYLVKAQYTAARQTAQRLLELAKTGTDPGLELVAHWTLGITLAHLGEFLPAREHLDLAVSSYDPQKHERLTYLYGQNPAVTCLIYSAFVLWFLGEPDQAAERSRMALDLAEQIAQPYSLAFVHGMIAVLNAVRGEADRALGHAEQTVSLSKKAGFPFLLAVGLCIRGWSRAEQGKTSLTTNQMRRGIKAHSAIGAELGRPIFLFLLAQAYAHSGEIDEAWQALLEAFEYADKNGERLNETDLYHLKGELLAMRGADESEVAACFQAERDTARQQGARTLAQRQTGGG